DARLDLVAGDEPPVPAAHLLRSFEIAPRREVDPLALEGLDDEQRQVLSSQLALERIEIAERHVREPGEKRAEAIDKMRVAARRERTECQSVESVLCRHDA